MIVKQKKIKDLHNYFTPKSVYYTPVHADSPFKIKAGKEIIKSLDLWFGISNFNLETIRNCKNIKQKEVINE